MTQDVMTPSLPTKFTHVPHPVVSTLVGDCRDGENQFASPRGLHRTVRPPQNSMMRLAVLNALRSGTCYSRF